MIWATAARNVLARPVIAAVLERDQTIAALRTERGQLAQQLLDTRNELNAARQEIVDVTRQREAAMAGVENARLLLTRLRENQERLKRSECAKHGLNVSAGPTIFDLFLGPRWNQRVVTARQSPLPSVRPWLYGT